MSMYAVYMASGVVILRNCSGTSSSGPVVCAQHARSRLIMQMCAVHGGSQGGILILDDAK